MNIRRATEDDVAAGRCTEISFHQTGAVQKTGHHPICFEHTENEGRLKRYAEVHMPLCVIPGGVHDPPMSVSQPCMLDRQPRPPASIANPSQ